MAIDPVDMLRGLVEIQSLSRQEQEAVNYLVGQMSALGLNAHIDEAGNAVGVREQQGPITCEVVLLGHIDTVPGDIPVRIEDGILYGRGSVDAKGPLATFVMAAAQADLPSRTRLIVIGAVEEEAATSKGARHAAAQYQPDYCIIGEPSGWDAATLGYKGRLLLDYERVQPMGHTAGPSTSVAEAAVDWWQAVKGYADEFNAGHDRLFDQLMPSLRHIQTTTDGLSDRVEATVGLRLPPDFDAAAFEALARDRAGDAQVRAYGHEAAYQSDRQTPLARSFNQVFREAGLKPRFKLKTGTSDMNVVGPIWNCPIVAYGPGDSQLDHTPEEHLVLDDYHRAIDVLKQVLQRLTR